MAKRRKRRYRKNQYDIALSSSGARVVGPSEDRLARLKKASQGVKKAKKRRTRRVAGVSYKRGKPKKRTLSAYKGHVTRRKKGKKPAKKSKKPAKKKAKKKATTSRKRRRKIKGYSYRRGGKLIKVKAHYRKTAA